MEIIEAFLPKNIFSDTFYKMSLSRTLDRPHDITRGPRWISRALGEHERPWVDIRGLRW